MKVRKIRRCNKCGNIVKYSKLKHTENKYKYECLHCDEDLWKIETYKSKKKIKFK